MEKNYQIFSLQIGLISLLLIKMTELIKKVKKILPDVPILIISSYLADNLIDHEFDKLIIRKLLDQAKKNLN